MITLTEEQQQFFNDQLKIIEKESTPLFHLIKNELEVVKQGGFDDKRREAFLETVKRLSPVKIPNIEEIENLHKA